MPSSADSAELFSDVIARLAQTKGDAMAIISEQRKYSYRAYDDAANHFAHALTTNVARAEHAPVAAIMCRNSIEYAITFLGMVRAGGLSVHISPRASSHEVAQILAQTDPDILVADPPCLDLCERSGLEPQVIRLDVGHDQTAQSQAYTNFFTPKHIDPLARSVDPHQAFAINYTGGTTGRPKGAISSHRARAVSALASAQDFGLTANDIAAVTTPMCHAAGLFSWFQPALHAGAACVPIARWQVNQFAQLVEDLGITCAFVVPTQLRMLLDDPEFSSSKLRTLRLIACGGAPLPEDLIAQTQEFLPQVALYRAYGSTETGHLLSQSPAQRAISPDATGAPSPYIDISVFRAPGTPADQGEIGEVATRGPHLMSHYLDAPEETSAFFKSDDGWGWTGDLGRIETDGQITLTGRLKDLIISGGMNIYPGELEAILNAEPDIADCAVFGLPNAKWGEVPVAAVVRTPAGSIGEQTLIDLCLSKVAAHKRLAKIFFVDAIPRTAAGKAQRHILSARFRP